MYAIGLSRELGMTYRRFRREIDMGEIGLQMAFDMARAEPAPKDTEEAVRAELAAKAVAGVRARKAKRRRSR